MGKRKNGRRKSTKTSYPGRITARTYKNIKREAENARSRIREYAKKTGNFTSAADAYRLENLMSRLEAGETSRTILKELRTLRGEKVASVFVSEFKVDEDTGEVIDTQHITNLVNKANKAIDRAKTKYAKYESIFPEHINANSLISLTTSENYGRIVDYLKTFTASNLKPVTRDGFSDITTQAQLKIDLNIIEEENKRREQRRKAREEGGVGGGYARWTDKFSYEPMDINSMKSFRELHARAQTYSDESLVRRANVWLDNYALKLSQLQSVFIMNKLHNDVVAQRFNYIYSVLEAVRGNAQLVELMSMTFRNIEIALLYNDENNIDFSAVYDDFCEFADNYLNPDDFE